MKAAGLLTEDQFRSQFQLYQRCPHYPFVVWSFACVLVFVVSSSPFYWVFIPVSSSNFLRRTLGAEICMRWWSAQISEKINMIRYDIILWYVPCGKHDENHIYVQQVVKYQEGLNISDVLRQRVLKIESMWLESKAWKHLFSNWCNNIAFAIQGFLAQC